MTIASWPLRKSSHSTPRGGMPSAMAWPGTGRNRPGCSYPSHAHRAPLEGGAPLTETWQKVRVACVVPKLGGAAAGA